MRSGGAPAKDSFASGTGGRAALAVAPNVCVAPIDCVDGPAAESERYMLPAVFVIVCVCIGAEKVDASRFSRPSKQGPATTSLDWNDFFVHSVKIMCFESNANLQFRGS